MKKFLLLALCLTTATAVFAGPVKFMASEDLSYDDNIYLTENNTKGSTISSTQVGAAYKSQIPGSGLNLAASAMGGYSYYTEDNGKNGFWNSLINAELSNKVFNFGNTFLYTSDPANSELTQRAERINNTLYFNAKTSSEKTLGLGVIAEDVYDHYLKNEFNYLNRNRINGGVQAFYNFSPKTNVFAEYVYSDITYQDNKTSNSTGNSFGLGVNGQIAQKVSGTAKVTYDTRDYDTALQGADSYVDLIGYYLSVEWQPTTRNTIRLSGQRKFEETLYGTNRFFTSTLVSLYASQKVMDKFTASLTLSYENMAYDKEVSNVKRSDDLYTLRPQLDYQFKEWLNAGVWYQFRDRSSNAALSDYTSNKGGIFVKALF